MNTKKINGENFVILQLNSSLSFSINIFAFIQRASTYNIFFHSMNIHSSSLGKAIKTVRKYTKYGRKSFSGDYFVALVIFPCKNTMVFA
jgi:hypothetical protein